MTRISCRGPARQRRLRPRRRVLAAEAISAGRQAGCTEGQDELFAAWRYHAVVTDSPFEMIQAEGQHRNTPIIEQGFADWNDGQLATTCPRGASRPTPPG